METIALLILLSAPQQITWRLPVTIEVKQDVAVVRNPERYESRGTLDLQDLNAKPFQLKKGQQFQMVKTGTEGSCRIRFENQEYWLNSCPWLEGFRDHQADIFFIVRKGIARKK